MSTFARRMAHARAAAQIAPHRTPKHTMSPRARRAAFAGIASLLLAAGCTEEEGMAAVDAAPPAEAPQAAIDVLSTRPEMVSAGDVLLQVSAMGDRDVADFAVRVDGRDVTGDFQPAPSVDPEGVDAEGRPVPSEAGARAQPAARIGLVTGLADGAHRIEVAAGASVLASREIVSHPVSGPIFSGPHQSPFIVALHVSDGRERSR